MNHKMTDYPPNTRIEVLSLSLFDPDALSDAVRSSNFEHMQLERGDFRGELKHVDFGRLTIDSGCYSRKLIARGQFPSDSVMLGCVLDSNEEGCINGYRFRSNDVVIFPKGAELHYVLPAATTWCSVQLSEPLLEDAGCTELGFDSVKVLSGHLPLVQLMRRFLIGDTPNSAVCMSRAGLSALANEEILLEQIRHVANQYSGDVVNLRRPSFSSRMAIMRQFENKVRERIDTVVRIPELCTELGVSDRTLEYLFREEIGMTPKQYSNVLRLNAARREMLRKRSVDQTVSQIAQRCGIRHLGRFANAYLRQFGELPSETLKGN